MGNLLIGSSVMAWPFSVSLSTRAEQLWRTLPLMTMVHAPQTSSRQPLSQTGGVVCWPEVVTGLAAMAWRQEMMFMLGRQGTANSSQRDAAVGLSWRRMRMVILRSVSVVGAMERRMIRGGLEGDKTEIIEAGEACPRVREHGTQRSEQRKSPGFSSRAWRHN